jgi:hypothetical protein
MQSLNNLLKLTKKSLERNIMSQRPSKKVWLAILCISLICVSIGAFLIVNMQNDSSSKQNSSPYVVHNFPKITQSPEEAYNDYLNRMNQPHFP